MCYGFELNTKGSVREQFTGNRILHKEKSHMMQLPNCRGAPYGTRRTSKNMPAEQRWGQEDLT